jgi:hypothetical protein
MHIQMGHGFTEAAWGVSFILALFACVVFHEFENISELILVQQGLSEK